MNRKNLFLTLVEIVKFMALFTFFILAIIVPLWIMKVPHFINNWELIIQGISLGYIAGFTAHMLLLQIKRQKT